jgi:aminopeptidase N
MAPTHRLLFCWILLFAAARVPGAETIHHRLEVRLDPAAGGIEVSDTLSLPRPVAELEFLLHAGLRPSASQGKLVSSGEYRQGDLAIRRYRLQFAQPTQGVRLDYRGTIHHPLQTQGEGYGAHRHTTPGLIGPEGVFLAHSSHWYPIIEDALLSFTLQVSLPEGWTAVSQGRELPAGGWEESAPQDEIYLLAGRYTPYRRPTPHGEMQVYLRGPDEALAQRYLEAGERHLRRFSRAHRPLPLRQVRPGGELLGERLRHALLHPAGQPGHPPPLHHRQLLSPRNPA